MSDSVDLNDYERALLGNIASHGCQITHVFDPDDTAPAFSYSVGFPETLGQPEAIVFGLSSKLMHFMLNEVMAKCRDGLILRDGARISGLLDGFDCVARTVSKQNIEPEYFNSAIWFERYRTGAMMTEAFQIVWPGATQGLFPWERNVSQEVIDAQPALYSGSMQ